VSSIFNRRPEPVPEPTPEATSENPAMTPLSMLAIDMETTVDQLAELLDSAVLLDRLHRPSIDTALAEAMIVDHQDAKRAAAREAAKRDADWRDRMAAHPDPSVRITAIAARQERMRQIGELDDDADPLTAIGYTRDHDARAEREADRHAALARGESSGGTFRIDHDGD
jgi:hypothetical protein